MVDLLRRQVLVMVVVEVSRRWMERGGHRWLLRLKQLVALQLGHVSAAVWNLGLDETVLQEELV